ncbi:hypothetical protein Zmor_013541 [Zophobas morio]|uniref:G-protein coupled receptors family 1 profile domain-containing protein n=1 Tax=Zophobas morio TaxID=2755281 RepID=A0AA38IFU6_9CUCU|nr:hypothetical protein Zmor_013541 [Zophobas morio]
MNSHPVRAVPSLALPSSTEIRSLDITHRRRIPRMCSLHFAAQCFYKSLQHRLLEYSPKCRRRLMPNAIPTKNGFNKSKLSPSPKGCTQIQHIVETASPTNYKIQTMSSHIISPKRCGRNLFGDDVKPLQEVATFDWQAKHSSAAISINKNCEKDDDESLLTPLEEKEICLTESLFSSIINTKCVLPSNEDSHLAKLQFVDTDTHHFSQVEVEVDVEDNKISTEGLRYVAGSRKSRMNYFITHLALADLSVGLISVLTDIIWKITIAWHAGNIACKLIRFLQVVVTYASTYVLVALSIDRYDAIRHPMRFSGSWKRAKGLILAAWFFSVLFSIPILIFYKEEFRFNVWQCWIDLGENWKWQLYMTLVSVSIFIIPAAIIATCYAVIIVTIWSKNAKGFVKTTKITNGSDNSRRASSRGLIPRAKVKTIKMTFVIVSVFIICWSPYIIFDLLQVFGQIPRSQTNTAIATLIQSLAPLNSAANPIIYCLFSTHFCRTLCGTKKASVIKSDAQRSGPKPTTISRKTKIPTRRSPRTNIGMTIQMSAEQFNELINGIRDVARPREADLHPSSGTRHFSHCPARFDGSRNASSVEEFITTASLYKRLEKISDEDALETLPILLREEALTWWNGVRNSVNTWPAAVQLIRDAFAPRAPNHRLFKEIFNEPQGDEVSTDAYITRQRERLSRMSRQLDEQWQMDILYGLLRRRLRDRIARTEVDTFADLLHKARAVEESEREGKNSHAKPNGKGPKADENRSRGPRLRCDVCRAFGHDTTACRRRPRGPAPAPGPATRTPAEPVRCYGCNAPGVFRRNCPTCNTTDASQPARNMAFCALRSGTIQPRSRPAIHIKIAGEEGTGYLDTAACNSVASATLYRHLIKTGHKARTENVIATLADGTSKHLQVPAVTTKVGVQGRHVETTFIVLSDSCDTRTLLGADFIEDARIIPDLARRRFYFGGDITRTYPFVDVDGAEAPARKGVPTTIKEVRITQSEPMEEGDIEEGYGPPPPAPPKRDTSKGLVTPHGIWTTYQAPYATEHMWEDAETAMTTGEMDEYEMGLFPDGPRRLFITSLRLQANEGTGFTEPTRAKFDDLVDDFADAFEAHGPPTPYAEHRIDTGDHAPIAVPPYQLNATKKQLLKEEVEKMIQARHPGTRSLPYQRAVRPFTPTRRISSRLYIGPERPDSASFSICELHSSFAYHLASEGSWRSKSSSPAVEKRSGCSRVYELSGLFVRGVTIFKNSCNQSMSMQCIYYVLLNKVFTE